MQLELIHAPPSSKPTPLQVLSLGAGVQSSTLLLMSLTGEFERPAHIIFADTGWEPPHIYAHLRWLSDYSQQRGLPIRRVGTRNIRSDLLAAATSGARCASMPLFVTNPQGKRGMLRRQCTHEYKIKPIRHLLRAILGRAPRPHDVELWIGITPEEKLSRRKLSDVQWITHRWPLIERGMTRDDCVAWLTQRGFPVPIKSACIGCPFHDNAHWLEMRANRPGDWADAVAFDHAIRRLPLVNGHVFVHRSLRPLADVHFEKHLQRPRPHQNEPGVCPL